MSSELLSALSANIHAQSIAQRDYEEAQAEAEKWERQYQLALQSGRKYLINETKSRQDIYIKKAQNCKAILNQQTQRVNHLRLLIQTPTSIQSNLATNEAICCHKRNKTLENRLHKVEGELEVMKAKLLAQQTALGELLKQNLLALESVRSLLAEGASDDPAELTSEKLDNYWSEIETDNSDTTDTHYLTLAGIARDSWWRS